MTQSIGAILLGDFVPEERILLESVVMRGDQELFKALSLNDVVFSRGALGSMIEFEVFIDDQFVYSQRSDGLIVTTPTGLDRLFAVVGRADSAPDATGESGWCRSARNR